MPLVYCIASLLFGNKQKEKVKMTSPVLSQKIAMTSPVLSDTGSMAFVMPEEFTFETTTGTLR